MSERFSSTLWQVEKLLNVFEKVTIENSSHSFLTYPFALKGALFLPRLPLQLSSVKEEHYSCLGESEKKERFESDDFEPLRLFSIPSIG